MAGFCKHCGAPVPFTSGFCPSCGTQYEAAPADPANAAAPAGPPPAAYAAVPPKKSGSTLKIVLIIVAVVVVLGVGFVGIAGYLGYRALHTAGNSFSLGKGADVSDSDLGVATYPGAARSANGGMKMNLAGNLVVSALYTTSDSVADVVAFYQGKLPTPTTSQSGMSSTLSSATVDGNVKDGIVVTVSPNGQGSTQIVIVHTKTSKP